MFIQLRRLAIATALIWIGVGASERVEAGGITLSTPAGLTPGESFRFVFVTDGTTDATSTNIADYNTFVNTQAGGATYNGSLVSWDAIGSTASVNAIDNIGQQAIAGVFLANGVEVTTTTTTTGLWSGILLAPINQDLSGSTITSLVWTGTTATGSGQGPTTLGTLSPFQGTTEADDINWVQHLLNDPPIKAPLYAISQVLVVPQSAVPEPSTLVLASMSLTAGLAFTWSRSRRAQRRQRPVGRPDAPE